MGRNNWEEAALQIIFPHPFQRKLYSLNYTWKHSESQGNVPCFFPILLHFSSNETILLYSIPLPFNPFLFPLYIPPVHFCSGQKPCFVHWFNQVFLFIKWSMQVSWLGASLFEGPLLPHDIQLVHQMGRQDKLLLPSISDIYLVGPWKRVFLLVALSLWNIISPEIWLAPNFFVFWKALMTWFCPWAWGPRMEIESIKCWFDFVAAATDGEGGVWDFYVVDF